MLQDEIIIISLGNIDNQSDKLASFSLLCTIAHQPIDGFSIEV
jgi:hypothetical protein